LGVREGDEIITAPNTFAATAEAIQQAGGKIVFADVDPRTHNINPAEIEKLEMEFGGDAGRAVPGVDPLSVTGSYGGAFGQTQFIPSSFREYSVDFDNDGKRDVWNSIPDILASIANYLHRFHWELSAPIYWELGQKLQAQDLVDAYEKGRKGLVPWQAVAEKQKIDMPAAPEDKDVTIVGLELEDGGMRYVAGYPNFQAITKWNNSNRYAMAVTELAEQLKK